MAEEKTFEKTIARECERLGLIALKQTADYMRGIPDRLIIFPGGDVEWVEFKSVGKRPTKIQQIRHEQLRRMGHTVVVIDSEQATADYIQHLRNRNRKQNDI